MKNLYRLIQKEIFTCQFVSEIPDRFRYLSYGLVVSTYILLLLGAYVKAIHAGLACPDWPLCYGKLIPSLEDHRVFAEWFHRLWAMLNGFYLLIVVLMSYKYRREVPTMYNLGVILVLLYAVQVIFGGLTVLRELEAVVVVIHLGNAVLIVILQLIISFIATINRAT